MKKRYFLAAAAAGALIPLAGCIDSSYDLSNLDTSMEVPVNDLTIPVNVGPVVLDNIIDIADSDCFDVMEVNGQKMYVYHYAGDFNSDKIHINSFSVEAPSDIEPSEVEVVLYNTPSPAPGRRAAAGAIEYEIKNVRKEFTYDINDVDDKVKDVTDIQTPSVTFSINLAFPSAVYADAESIHLTDVRIEFPKGLRMKNGNPAYTFIDGSKTPNTAAVYNPADGIVTLKDYVMTSRILTLTLEAQDINVKEVGAVLSNGQFQYDGHIDVLGGSLLMTPKAGVVPTPRFMVGTEYDLTSFEIENFSGKVDYDIEGLNFDAVNLNSMPDFLSKPGTEIRLADPQLYISFYNTCAQYGLGGETHLDVTPMRDGYSYPTISMDEDIIVGSDKGMGPYRFAISPSGDNLKPMLPEYADAEKLQFDGFSDILYTPDGIPTSIDVEFAQPQVLGEAYRFPLKLAHDYSGKGEIDAVHGTYEFRAPLALKDGSKIYYGDTSDDFDTDMLDDLYVNKMVVRATATSEIPLDVNLSAKLYDKHKNEVGYCHPALIPAGEKTDFVLQVTAYPDAGNPDPDAFMKGINSIEYSVTAISESENAVSLSPDQKITLDNFTITVSGKYVSLDDGDDDEDYGYND